MNKDLEHIIGQLINMYNNDFVEENYLGFEGFEGWCEDNIYNERQEKYMKRLRNAIDILTTEIVNIIEEEKQREEE